MPSQTVNLSHEQAEYIQATIGEEQSVSDRVREILDAGIEAEETEQ
jgi:hypothetical protein